MKKTTILLFLACLATGSAPAQNLLVNGDFNDPASGAAPTSWTPFTSGGWANHENNAPVTYDGSYYIVAGQGGTGNNGFDQVIGATGGIQYTLSVLSGADTWWLPYGQMSLTFRDAGNAVLGQAMAGTVDPAVYGQNYDIAHPWKSYSLDATAPAGTTQVQVEFMTTGTGSVWFENAMLTAVPEPSTVALVSTSAALLVSYRRRKALRA
jgi:hypothetical protein